MLRVVKTKSFYPLLKIGSKFLFQPDFHLIAKGVEPLLFPMPSKKCFSRRGGKGKAAHSTMKEEDPGCAPEP